MASQFDESDFIDRDYLSSKTPHAPGASHAAAPGTGGGAANRPLTREELEAKVGETQHRLMELKRAQEELERERAALEEARRRRAEFQTGREEMLHSLTRGVQLLEEAEFAARRDAEQMTKTLEGLRDGLQKVAAIQEELWNDENWNVELTRALTTIENARMEWNAARLKWAMLNGVEGASASSAQQPGFVKRLLEEHSFWQLCKLGLAFTWPIAVLGLIGIIAVVVAVLSK